MKKILIYLLILSSLILLGCETPENGVINAGSSEIDTTKFTDVIIVNSSKLDSVPVYITLQSSESIVGLFGMDSSNIKTICTNISGKDTTYIPCIGMFYAKKGVEYHFGSTKPAYGVIVTFGVQNQNCEQAISNGWETGINNFEFTINCFDKTLNPSATGGNESFDITLVDGLHSYLRQSVTSQNWNWGAMDKNGKYIPFKMSQNTWPMSKNVNIPGVYPYGCDMCYESQKPPTPICFEISCSTKYPGINTCQTNRTGQGGIVKCEFLGYVPEALAD